MPTKNKPLAWATWETPDRVTTLPGVRNETGDTLPRLLLVPFANGALKITATRRPLTMLSTAAGTARTMHTWIDSALLSEPEVRLGKVAQALTKRLRLEGHRYIGSGVFENVSIEAALQVLAQIRSIAPLPDAPTPLHTEPTIPSFLKKEYSMPEATGVAVSLPALTIAGTDIHQDDDGRYCLNDLHKAAGGENKHRPKYWLENQQTQELVCELEKGGFPPIQSKQGVGTYVCKELVYAYAMWISPRFHLAVIRAFDALVTGKQQIALASAPHHLIAQAARSRAWRYAEEQRQVFMAAIGSAAKPGDDETAWSMASLLMTRIEERLVQIGMDMAHKHSPQTVASWLLNWRPETQLAMPHQP